MGESQLTTETIIGNYRIEEQVGRGGMGVVYRGRHLNLPREVAIKIVKAPSSDDLRRHRSRFEREAFIQSQLDHPGIVKVYDYIIGEANYYIVMEYVEGCSLAELLARHPRGLDIARALDIFQQILAAISYAHTFVYRDEEDTPHTGIIHRDLKPANILITPDDHAKITDFGIVKLVGADDTKTFSRPYGTPQYVSPEQAQGRDLDQRSDIYSLGIILYELLTGVPPFGGRANGREVDGEDGAAGVGSAVDKPLLRSEILRAHVGQPPRPPSELNPEICPDLEAAILRALAKEPEARFSSVVEFARAARRAGVSGNYTRHEPSAIHDSSAPDANDANGDNEVNAAARRVALPTGHLVARNDNSTIDLSLTARTSYVTQPIGESSCATCGADAEPGDRTCQACGSDLQASPATKTLVKRSGIGWRLSWLAAKSSSSAPWLKACALLLVAAVGSAGGYALYRRFFRPASSEGALAASLQNAPQNAAAPDASAVAAPTPPTEIVKVAPASVSVDSSFNSYNAAPLTDGVTDPARIGAMRYNRGNWASAESPQAHWIEFEFDAPVELATVYLYWGFDRSRFIPSRQVELLTMNEATGEWRTVANIEPGEDYDRTAFDFIPFTTRRIRVRQPASMGSRTRPFVMWVREIEAYAVVPKRDAAASSGQ